MKKHILIFLLLFSSLFAREGIEYSQREIFSYFYLDNQVIHILEIDPDLYEIKPVKAVDSGIGRESVLSLAKRHGALAAINGGFFSIGGTLDGKACGALKIHEWIALPTKHRGCIGWGPQSPVFDRLRVYVTCDQASKTIVLDGLNCSRKEGQAILFTPLFHRTTLTGSDGEEILIQNGKITAIYRGRGSSVIPSDGAILSIQKAHPLFGKLEVGAPISYRFRVQTEFTPAQNWAHLDYIVGGTPLLIYHEEKITDFSPEETIQTFLIDRHSRTAVGLLPNGHWLFVVVDKAGVLDGMTMGELADFMESLGCVYALNLDGGGSSTMVYEGDVKNTPHGDEDEGLGREMIRRVSDAFIVIPKCPH